MDISQIKAFLNERGQACLYDFSAHFNIEEEEIRTSLEKLKEEGKVKKEIISHCCNSGCYDCFSDSYEFYSWIKS